MSDEGILFRMLAIILWAWGEKQENCSVADQELKNN